MLWNKQVFFEIHDAKRWARSRRCATTQGSMTNLINQCFVA